MNYLQVEIVSWNRFITRNLVIVPEMLGLEHEFLLGQSKVRIKLPDNKDIPTSNAEHSRLLTFTYKIVDGNQVPTMFGVESVDVLVQLGKQVSIPEEMLTEPPNAYDLLSKEQQTQLDEMAQAHGDVAREAFDVWIRTLRWKSHIGVIGRPEIHGFESGWSTYLLNDETKTRLWRETQILTLPPGKPITLEEWNNAEEVLKLGERPPVYIDLMFDGMEHLDLGDFRRATVDFAVACEAFVRSKVLQQLPHALSEPIKRYIDETNIRYVLRHFFPETLSEDQKKILKRIDSALHQLFNARNDILHSGYKEGLTGSECQKYLNATQKLIAI
jgi:hypothetical protein